MAGSGCIRQAHFRTVQDIIQGNLKPGYSVDSQKEFLKKIKSKAYIK
jgi:hypothetical protein